MDLIELRLLIFLKSFIFMPLFDLVVGCFLKYL